MNSELNPALYLLAALLGLGLLILWGLTIYVSAKLARRQGRKVASWILLAVGLGFTGGGPILLCTGWLAHANRRSPAVWVVAEVLALAAAVGSGAWLLGRTTGEALGLLSVLLIGECVLAILPVLVLALLGPRPRPPAAPAPSDGPLIGVSRLHKTYHLGSRNLHVLRGVTLNVRRGEFVAILGASGSGKSTLLHLMGLLDSPDSGGLVFDAVDSAALLPAERDRLRCRDIGFVFQFYHLLPELDALENVLLPAMAECSPWAWLTRRRQLRQQATEMLTRLGLGERLTHRPRQLSGGEQQRVAIARALMNRPKVLLADEPTGNLDSHTGGQILKLLKQLNAETGQTIIMVTHDQALAALADRVLHLQDGKFA